MRRRRYHIRASDGGADVVARMGGEEFAVLMPETELGQALQVALLQTNIAQDEKFAAERMPAALAWVAQALTSARAPPSRAGDEPKGGGREGEEAAVGVAVAAASADDDASEPTPAAAPACLGNDRNSP